MKVQNRRINNLNWLNLFVIFSLPISRIIQRITIRITKRSKRKVLIVLGLSRSGTTMLGEFLSINRDTFYIHEPVKQLFKLQSRSNGEKASIWRKIFDKKNRKKKIHYFLSTLLFHFVFCHSAKTICIKEVSMTDVIEELSGYLKHVQVLYISRHPCGRIDSMIRDRQQNQKIENPGSAGFIKSISITWGQNIKYAQNVCNKNPNWSWVVFEKITANPIYAFRDLYENLNLPWSKSVATWIKERTTGRDGGFHQTQRIANKQATKWESNLTLDQIKLIQTNTINFDTKIYSGF